MGFLDDMAKKVGSVANEAGSKAKTVATEAGSKAKDVAGIAKLSAEVGSKEKDMAKLFVEIGKKVYESDRDSLPEELKEAVEKIDTIKAAIESLNAKIDDIKNS